MDNSQALTIKAYCEGAYPNMKKDDTYDVVWFDMLKDYQYQGIMQSVKKYIMAGNKFPPTIAELIQGYETLLTDQNEKLVEMVARELDVTNGKNIESIRNMVYHPNLNEILKNDDWLPNAIRKCKNQLVSQLFGSNLKKIGG